MEEKDKAEREAFRKITETSKMMLQIDSVIKAMTEQEFQFYINLVEIPHTNTLKEKFNYKEGVEENEKD